jgi:hypothetical protein
VSTKRWHTREDSGIRLDRQLRWWHDDEPVEHPRVIEAFNRGLKVTDDGKYRLEFGNDWCFVAVEDAAYGVTAIDVSDGDVPSVRLSDRTAEPLDVATLELGDDGVLTARVKGGRAKARFSRDAQFALGEMVEPTERGYVLRVGQRAVPLPAEVSF